LVNGLVPHFTGGTLDGTVSVAGRDTRRHPPRALADLVGVVGQDPLAGFVTDTVEEELAYTMEQLAVPADAMRKRVEETLDLLGLAGIRHRPLHELSGGQQQRVAIGAVLTAQPKVLVLDEPTSALDPTAAEEVLAAITRLVHDIGITVLMSEHRLERVVQYADRVVHLRGDGTAQMAQPQDVFVTSSVAPPVVELGRLASWSPLPLSVRDARRRAPELIARLDAAPARRGREPLTKGDSALLRARQVVVRYGSTVAVRDIDLDLAAGQITALMGRNGSGKSSLLWALQGSGRRQSGGVLVAGEDPATLPAKRARQLVGLIPQSAADLLYFDTVAAELAQADRESDLVSGSSRVRLDQLSPGIVDDMHPRDLSEGQRLALVLAVQLSAAPPVLLLDEPTRGLDYPAKRHLGDVLESLADDGHAIVVATHDVEFAASCAQRVIVMADGEFVADGAAGDVLTASAAFAPQVAKILAPLPYLTVPEVRGALGTLDAEVPA
jgi:energy-coupling factor transport system ATP-binding protein